MNRETKLHLVLDFAFLASAVAGFSINLYLLSRRITETASGIAGCGGGACDEILLSRWSLMFGIPVTALGVAVWFGLIASSTEFFRNAHRPLLGAVGGAALWFVLVQGLILTSYCPWCMAAHGAGLAAVSLGAVRMALVYGTTASIRTIAVWTFAAFLGIGLAQVYGPVPATHRIDDLGAPSRAVPAPAAEGGRIVFFDDRRISYQVATLPRHGRADAEHVIVEFFDYQCAACRTMAAYVNGLVAKHPGKIAVLLLPVPMEKGCNNQLPAGNQRPGSCEIARIALAVWRVNPDAFAGFHHVLLSDPSPDSARRMALTTMPPERLESALADPWIEAQLRQNVADWRSFSKSTNKLPKLLIRDRRILHGLPSGEADFIRVMEGELKL